MKLFEYFERKWPREWLEEARPKIQNFYSQYNNPNEVTSDTELNASGVGKLTKTQQRIWDQEGWTLKAGCTERTTEQSRTNWRII